MPTAEKSDLIDSRIEKKVLHKLTATKEKASDAKIHLFTSHSQQWLITIDCNDIQQSRIQIKKHRYGISSVKYTKIAIDNPFVITQRPSIIPAPIHRSRTNKTGQNIRATDDNVHIDIANP